MVRDRSEHLPVDAGPALYPPTPEAIPELGRMTFAYRLRVVLVLFSLAVFLLFYVGMVAGSAWLTWSFWELHSTEGRERIFQIGAGITSGLLFLFLLKGLFKRSKVDTDHMIEVTADEQPVLYDFVRRLCRDAGSVLPRKIYITADVNAAVAYPRSLLTLVWPVRKDLIIGLGLVNVLNLSQFKAVLAHEFGHFAQSSMKLGQYVYVANQVIADMVYQRDFWDDLIYHWRRIDIRLSFPAWILSFVVWILRHVLGLAFRVINLFNLSLSRQMEFNADLRAVRLAGSDALISGLLATERGSLAYQISTSDLASLADHRVYSDDLYHHQSAALGSLRESIAKDDEARRNLAYLLDDYSEGKDIHFPVSEAHASSMWATHPSNRDREVNAKWTYVRVAQDQRPAWALFREPEALRSSVSLLEYRRYTGTDLRPADLSPAREVHEKILEEKEEMKQAEHYHGLYDDRYVRPGDISALAAEIDRASREASFDPAALRAEAAAWTGSSLEAVMESQRRLHDERRDLVVFSRGERPAADGPLNFREQSVDAASVEKFLETVDADEKELLERLAGADRAMFRWFYYLSGREDAPGRRGELLQRYEFLAAVQELIGRLNTVENRTAVVIEALQSGRRLSEEDAKYAQVTFHDGRKELRSVVKECEALLLPRLSLIEAEESVRSFVLPGDIVRPPEHNRIRGEWIQEYLTQLHQVLGRLRKLHFKNLGLLLKLQETLDPGLFAREPEPEAKERDLEAEVEGA